MSVYGYTRVSTAMQVEGVSLDEQQRMISGRAQEMGWELTQTFVERGVSGGTPFIERPEGARLNTLLRAGDIVIAAKLDRMFRSSFDALDVIRDFQARGVSLWLLDLGGDVSGNGIAQLIMTVLAAFAEFERHRIGERIKDAKRHQRRAQKYLGGFEPFGWREVDGHLVEEPTEQDALVTLRYLRRGGWSLRDIVTAIRRTHGLRVSKDTVRRVLQREDQQ